MKGIVFTEFLEMVEHVFGLEVVDEVVEACDLASGGAYTAVGTYSHGEMVQLVQQLSRKVNLPVPALYQTFGKHLFGRFHDGYPQFFGADHTAFSFLKKIDNYIHVEVRKLYPDAELPKFEYEEYPSDNKLVMIYHSSRAMGDFATGLILGCVEYFGEKIDLRTEDISGGKGTDLRFILTKAA